MSELVFATFLVELKKVWKEQIADADLINLLYDAVSEPAGILNKSGEPITVTASTASKIINRLTGGNPNQDIRTHSQDDEVRNGIENYFEKKVVRRILKGTEDDLIHRLSAFIRVDSQTSDSKKEELLKLAQKNTLALFLANVYLYSLSKPNVKCTEDTQSGQTNSVPENLEDIPVPDNLAVIESTYTNALFEAYGQAEKIPQFSVDMLADYPKYQTHFAEQRKYYFAAEAVRRGVRDIYRPGEKDQFDILKDEMFEGVKDVWDEEYKNALARLRGVFAQASKVCLDRCIICRDTTWVGGAQRKGVCHFLVDEKRLNGWVRDDDEESI